MSYTKTQWRNNQSPAINADNLNHIEQGVYDAHQDIAENTQNIESLTTQTGANTSAIALEKTERQQAVTAETLARESTDNNLQAQIDQLVAPSGTAPNPAEIENARIGADGVTYDTLGNAIRTQVTNLKSDLEERIQLESALNLCNMPGVITVEEKFINGTTETAGSFYSFKSIPVTPGAKYDFYCEGINDVHTARFVNFYDSDNVYISGSTLQFASAAESPANAYYMSASFAYIAPQGQKKKGEYYIKNLLDWDDKAIIQKELENPTTGRLAISAENAFSQKLRLATFCFIFDDGNDTDINVYNYFMSVGKKCGFALLSTEADIDRYRRYQAKGFEILSHSTDALVMDSSSTLTDDQITAKIKGSKTILESYGFKIYGFVTPSTTLRPSLFDSVKANYAYGFGKIQGGADVYAHNFIGEDLRQIQRYGDIATLTYSDITNLIDSAITNKQFVCFYAHSINTTVQDTIDYIVQKEADGDCKLLTPHDAIGYFYSANHTDFANGGISNNEKDLLRENLNLAYEKPMSLVTNVTLTEAASSLSYALASDAREMLAVVTIPNLGSATITSITRTAAGSMLRDYIPSGANTATKVLKIYSRSFCGFAQVFSTITTSDLDSGECRFNIRQDATRIHSLDLSGITFPSGTTIKIYTS